jgi:DNA replication protein DnaC
MIDWSNLHTFEDSRRTGFEQFCYTIAKRKYGHLGSFTPIDDSGGGSGVEFYLTFPDDTVWGWQAKFFSDGRLSNGSRKTQIKKSLKRSCEDHPTLNKWFLCTPTDLTVGEQEWFEGTLSSSILDGDPVVPVGRVLELKHWGDTRFNNFLTEGWATGIYSYYFGELELSQSWFEGVYRKAKHSQAGKQYTADLHSKSDVGEEAHRVLLSEEYRSHLKQKLEKIETSVGEFHRAIDKVKRGRTSHAHWEGSSEAYLAESQADDALEEIDSAVSQIRGAVEYLRRNQLDFSDVLDDTEERIRRLRSFEGVFEQAIGLTRRREQQNHDFSEVTSDEHDIYTKARNVLYPCGTLLKSLLKAQENVLHVLGGAGTGKTHLAFDLCHSRIEADRPAILLLGSSVTSREPLRRQFLNELDVPPSYSWKNFLDALNVTAEGSLGRLPIVIDGLNESVVNGELSAVWKDKLEGFADEIEQYENLALITTCRTAYVDYIWQDGEPESAVKTQGFGRKTEEAVRRYFDYYKIDANLTGAPLEQFEHPIYLRIFCKATNPSHEEIRHVHLGEHKLFEVFEDYVDRCNRKIVDQLGKRPGTDVLRPALNRIAHVLWEEKKRRIPVDRAIKCIDQVPKAEIDEWEQSLSHAIEDEGLLLSRTWSQSDEGDEEYEFAYDLMAGYFIASAIIDLFDDDLEAYLNDEDTLEALYGHRDQIHPLHEDINRCLAALLPEKKERYLHDVINYQEPAEYSINALFEIKPSYVNEDAVNVVREVFDTPESCSPLFELFESTWLHPRHPLGAQFIEDRLMEMNMAERDLAWSEYIRDWQGREKTENAVAVLYERCSGGDPIQEREENRLHLLATRVMWTLTTTIRPLRDKATRALYWYGRHFLDQFFDLIKRSFRIDDPYVRERMLAAAYGAAMARQYDFESDEFVNEHLPNWSRFIYEDMFGSQARYRTSHILMRDYARHIINIAEMHHPNLFTPEELDVARPSYDGGDIDSWGTDKGRPATDDSVGPILMDFSNYTLGSLVPDRSNYDDEHPVFEKLKGKAYWRIYDLGWTTDRFGKIDREIQSEQSLSRHNQSGKTDRYGKKYSWIAYFELYGHRLDHDAVDQWDVRLSDVDIDPSFPEPPPSQQLLNQNWLGSPEIETESWIENGDIPNLESFAVLDEILGEEGPWVLLSAFYNHDEAGLERDLWFRVCGALVETKEIESSVASDRLREKVHSGNIIPSNYYTFAGEVPWADTFPYNQELPIRNIFDSRSYPKNALRVANKDDMTEGELSKVYEELERVFDNHSGSIGSVDEIKEVFDYDGVEFELVPTGSYEIECVNVFQILPAAWRNDWEGHHNEINTGPRGHVPARQICESLGLVSRPQTYDLFEPSGDRATLTTHFEEQHGSVKRKQQFLYIRKGLIEQYLTQTNQALLIWMGGERQYSTKVFSDKRREEDVSPPFRTNFHDVYPYDPSG